MWRRFSEGYETVAHIGRADVIHCNLFRSLSRQALWLMMMTMLNLHVAGCGCPPQTICGLCNWWCHNFCRMFIPWQDNKCIYGNSFYQKIFISKWVLFVSSPNCFYTKKASQPTETSGSQCVLNLYLIFTKFTLNLQQFALNFQWYLFVMNNLVMNPTTPIFFIPQNPWVN